MEYTVFGKRIRIRRLLSVLLAALLCAGSPAALAESGEDPFTIWVGESSHYIGTTLVQELMEEQLGFSYEVEWAQGALDTALMLKLLSGDQPDIYVFRRDVVAAEALIRSGLVMPMDDYVSMPETYPNLASIPHQVLDIIRAENDGVLWYLPGWYAQEVDAPWTDWTVAAWWFRQDILDELGFTEEDVSTLEGIEAFARAAAQLTDDNGEPIIPISYSAQDAWQNCVILNAFGIDTAPGRSGMMPVTEIDGEQVFLPDHPNLKEAYRWINRMYREGLIDPEVITQDKARLEEKYYSGRIASLPGEQWAIELKDMHSQIDLGAWNAPAANTQPYPVPTAGGEKGRFYYVDPFCKYMVFVSSQSDQLEQALEFLDWCNEQIPERNHEINDGPVGVNWHWVDEEYGEWEFRPEYKALRDSGDLSQVDYCTPQLYFLGSYSNRWYAWWTQYAQDMPYTMRLRRDNARIAETFGVHREMHDYDAVPMKQGGVMSSCLYTLNGIYAEYSALLTIAPDDATFEKLWDEMQLRMETEGRWSAMKEEWAGQYAAYTEKSGKW